MNFNRCTSQDPPNVGAALPLWQLIQPRQNIIVLAFSKPYPHEYSFAIFSRPPWLFNVHYLCNTYSRIGHG